MIFGRNLLSADSLFFQFDFVCSGDVFYMRRMGKGCSGDDVESENRNLLISCREGDTRAFSRLVETFAEYAFRIAFRTLWNEEAARDIVQDCFIRIWQNRKRLDPDRKVSALLYMMITRSCYDLIRSEKRRRNRHQTVTEDPSVSWYEAESVETSIVNRDLADRIRKAAGHLSPIQRIVFILRDLEGLSIQETAEAADLSTGSVRSNLYHARNRIRKTLKEKGLEGESHS